MRLPEMTEEEIDLARERIKLWPDRGAQKRSPG